VRGRSGYPAGRAVQAGQLRSSSKEPDPGHVEAKICRHSVPGDTPENKDMFVREII